MRLNNPCKGNGKENCQQTNRWWWCIVLIFQIPSLVSFRPFFQQHYFLVLKWFITVAYWFNLEHNGGTVKQAISLSRQFLLCRMSCSEFMTQSIYSATTITATTTTSSKITIAAPNTLLLLSECNEFSLSAAVMTYWVSQMGGYYPSKMTLDLITKLVME